MRSTTTMMALACAGLTGLAPQAAEACGCFAPPSPAEPVIQAGERIAFAVKDGRVTAHIQIQYQGSASDFAWLVPVPTVPDVRVGTEELFDRLEATTGPQFTLRRSGGFCGGDESLGCGGFGAQEADVSNNTSPPDAGVSGGGPGPIAVLQSSAGPYDFAVVRADDKVPMIEWLNDNRYFVPANLATLVDPYIRPGAYFLALRLRADQEVGDIQPVVIDYEADLPMIPIVLTQMGATEDMGVLVWVLGDARAVPHNYQHVVVNEAQLNWQGGGSDYTRVVSAAVDEAAEGHAFVTDYAGPADVVGRFFVPDPSLRPLLSDIETLGVYVSELVELGLTNPSYRRVMAEAYPPLNGNLGDEVYEAQVLSWIQGQAYDYEQRYGFDAEALTDALWTEAVEPLAEANRLLAGHGYLTRLYTTLDPEEMTEDPVFAYNPDLPDVDRLHTAAWETVCDDDQYPSRLILPDGRTYLVDDRGALQVDGLSMPFAEQIQVLRQEGLPEVVVDNRAALAVGAELDAGGGCRSGGRARSRLASLATMVGLIWGVGRWSRRRRARTNGRDASEGTRKERTNR